MYRFFLLLSCLLFFRTIVPGQAADTPFFSLTNPVTFNKPRFWTAVSSGTLAYSGAMYGLYNAWYAGYPAGKFHTFNDLQEWNQMDKTGHLLMSYQESRWIFSGARWTGMRPETAAWVGFAGGQLIQTSFEVYDGFSSQWGFSWSDVGFNLLGSGSFLAQQLAWNEQRIVFKMSALPVKYNNTPIPASGPAGTMLSTTLQERADELYGTGPANLFLKNYNTLAVWVSVNPRAFAPAKLTWWPKWLNLAAGIGADNLFAGTGYQWNADKDCAGPDCISYQIDPARYPRTRQFFLSFDIDYTRLGVKNPFLKAVLSTVNILKFPAPTLELTDRGQTRFHFVYF